MRLGHESAIKARRVFLLLALPSPTTSTLLQNLHPRSILGIDWGPAPSPEDGPPLSANASRNRALLPAQIGGIIGAYLLSVCIVSVVLIFLNRKARKRRAIPGKVVDIEMVARSNITINTNISPISPGGRNLGSPRNFSWPSPEKSDPNPYVFPATNCSPITPPGTDPYVDSRIVQADREMAARDLEEMYAHVMEQEEAKAMGMSPKEMPPPPQLQRMGGMPATSPQRSNSPKKNKSDRKNRPANINLDETKSTKSVASSIMSALRSPRSKKSVRSIQISSPLPTPISAIFPHSPASDEEPLSPKYYKPPPPVPTDQAPYSHSRNNSNNVTPTSPTRSIAEQLAPYGPGASRNQRHRTYSSQNSMATFQEEGPSYTTPTSATAPPMYSVQKPHPNPTASNPPASTNASQRTLPFRAFDPPLVSPSFKPATKTTVLERTGPQHSGPLTSGLKTPWSAGAVPYSPYQPFTPMVPITPRLVTKADRKMMKKAEKKKRGPVTELVGSDDDMWDSGY